MKNARGEKMKDLSKRTAVIVLNWNKPEMTIECLESLQTMEGEYDIFIVDIWT